MTPRVSLSITVLCFALAACKKSPVATADAGAPERIPAPTSSLARELNTDDAGRGEYRAFDDGPWCGFAPRVDRDKPLDRSPDYPPPEASWMGFFETKTAPPDGPRLYERAAISLSLTGPARAFTRKLLPLTLSLKNGSAAPFQYGLPVDGSFEHWRVPAVDLYAREETSARIYRWTLAKGVGRCSDLGSRTPEDFVILPPGKQTNDPFGRHAKSGLTPVLMMAGRYTLWVVYASSCIGVERPSSYGPDAPRPPDLFEGTIASNGITVEVTEEQ